MATYSTENKLMCEGHHVLEDRMYRPDRGNIAYYVIETPMRSDTLIR